MSRVLTCKNLGIDFGGLTAVNNLNLEIDENEIVGLIGPNGAGKTTVFNLLTKVYAPSRGNIFLYDRDVTGNSTVQMSKDGVARTFQNIRLFDKLSVIDNVVIGMHNKLSYTMLEGIFKTSKYRRQEKEAYAEAEELLEIFDLKQDRDSLASSLPYGKQRKLEILRALATDPKLLLLDEPAAGMNPQETEELMNTIKFIRDHFEISILLIEHDMNLVMNTCERIYVLNYGTLLAKGTPEEIRNDKRVISAYLGE